MAEIARGEITIDVRDKDSIAALRRIDSEFDRTMDKIDRQRATAHADLDTSGFDQEVKNTKRKIRELEGYQTTLKVDGRAFKRVDGEIAALRKDLKLLDGERATVELKVKGRDEIRKAQNQAIEYEEKVQRAVEQAAERRFKAIQKEASRRARLRKQQEREESLSERNRLAAIQRRSAVSASLRRQESQEARAAEREAYSMEAARTREELALKRQSDALPKLRSEYVKLMRQVEDYDRRRRAAGRTGDARAVLQVDIDQEGALARMAAVRKELEAANALDPLDIELNVNRGRRSGELLRDIITNRDMVSATALGVALGGAVHQGFRRRITPASIGGVVTGAIGRGLSRAGQLAEGLSRATVRIGPFTATIKQALVGLAVLGPVIVDVVGALGPLVGVLGSATAGLGALSVGFLGGAIPAAIGFFSVIKPVTEQFGAAMKASDAYQQALMKGNEDLAAKKLKELESVLGNVDKRTVQNFKNAGKLAGAWEKATKPARASAFKVIGEGLSFATKNMDMFARNTNQGMDIAGKSITRMIRGLGSAEGRNILDTMFGNFNKTLGPLLDGIGNIGTYLGRVGAVASGFMPGLARQFKNWSQGVADGASNTSKLREKVTTAVDSLKALGRFMLAGGRFLKAFFGAGVGEGQRFLDTMTAALNRWTAFLQTTEGRNKLQDFFSRAVAGTQALWSALAPITRAFVGWASALSPFVAAFFTAAGVVATLVGKFLSLTALRGPITALAATLGTLWAVGKIGAAVSMIGNFTRAILGIKAAAIAAAAGETTQAAAATRVAAAENAAAAATTRHAVANRALATSTAAAAAGATAATASGLLLPAAAARNVGTAGKAAGQATGRFAGLRNAVNAGSLAMLGMRAATAGWIGAAVIATAAIYKLTDQSEKHTKQAQLVLGAARNMDQGYTDMAVATRGAAGSFSQYQRAAIGVREAQGRVNQLVKDGKRGTDEHKLAVLDLKDAQNFATQSLEAGRKQQEQASKSAKTAVKDARTLRDQYQKWARSLDEGERKTEEGQRILSRYREHQERLTRALNTQAAVTINNQRAVKGLAAYTGKAAQQVGQFARTFKGVPNAKKFTVQADDTKAGAKVAKLSNDLGRLGQKKTAVRILGDSKNVEEAIRRLQRARIKAIRVKILQEGGEKALQMVRRLVGARLAPKVMRILGSDDDARTKYRKLRALGIPVKIAKMLGENSDAIKKAEQANKQKLRTLFQIIQRTIFTPDAAFQPLRPIQQLVKRKVSGGADGATFASGGVTAPAKGGTGATPNSARMARAEREAERSRVRDIRSGGRVSRPTLLAGEENRTEFVISTNPRYRKRNEALLLAAARTLRGGKPVKGISDEGIIPAAGGYFPSLAVPDYSRQKGFSKKERAQTKFKFSKKKKRQIVPNNPFADRLARLDTQQSDLEREVNLREGAVREPEDFVIERPQPDGSVKYEFDHGAWAAYTGLVQKVLEAYQSLLRVVQEIRETIPKARNLNAQHIQQHKINIGSLRGQVNSSKQVISRTKGNSARAKATRKKHQARLAKLEPKLSKEKERLQGRQEFAKGLPERDKEAGFDYREFGQQIDNINADLGQKQAAAQKEIAGGGAGGGGAGGGGASSPSLSYGQQQASAAAEQMSVLRDYASNTNPQLAPRTAGAPGRGEALAAGGRSSPMTAAGASLTSSASPMRTAASTDGGMVGSSGLTATKQASDGGASLGGTTGASKTTNVTINNEFTQPPPDAHTWSKGVEFELGVL